LPGLFLERSPPGAAPEKELYTTGASAHGSENSRHLFTMGNLKKKRRLKMNKHKRRKRLKANRHKKRTWQK
jgi:hypothetical protein